MLKQPPHIVYYSCVIGLFFFLSACKSKKETNTARNPVNTEVNQAEKDYSFGTLYVEGCSQRMKGNLQQALKLFEECKKIYPQNAAASYELGTINKLLGNNEEAIKNARICASADVKNEWYQLLLIECYNAGKQYAQAIKVRENLVKNFPAKSEFKEDLAIEYALTGQYDQSFKLYDQLEKNYGVTEQITLNKVKLLKSQRKNKEAETELKKLLASNKNETRYCFFLADFYLEQNQLEKAKEMYDQIVKLEPLNPSVNLALHDYYTSKGANDEAFIYLKKAFENPELELNTKANILSEYYKGAEQGDQKSFSNGFELAKIMVQLHPKATESNGIYGDFLRLDHKLKEAAGYYYLAALNEKRNYRVWRNLLYTDNELMRYDSLEHHSAVCLELFPTLPEAYLFNGLANIQLKNYKKSVQSLKDGLEFVIDNKSFMLDFLRALGDANFYLKDYPKSDKAFDDALKIDSDNTYVLNNYAYFLSLRNENLDKAEKYSKRANDLRPNDRSYMDTYGWILFQQKKYPEAESWLEKAAKTGSADAVILEHYGDALYRNNKPADAMLQWNAAKLAGGNSETLLQKIKKKKLDD